MTYDAFFADALATLHEERRYRVFADLERIAGRFPHAFWHSPQGKRNVVIWCSNDYLGMGQHPKVIGAMVETATRMGAGAGGTRNIAGTNHPLVELEAELADLHAKEAALVFTSGYVSNQTGIATIAKLLPDCLILSDAWNHNSMIEGVRQAGTEKQIWRHNDPKHLEELLAAQPRERPKLIVFEGLYSMDGDVAPIKAICDLAETYNAMTYCAAASRSPCRPSELRWSTSRMRQCAGKSIRDTIGGGSSLSPFPPSTRKPPSSNAPAPIPERWPRCTTRAISRMERSRR